MKRCADSRSLHDRDGLRNHRPVSGGGPAVRLAAAQALQAELQGFRLQAKLQGSVCKPIPAPLLRPRRFEFPTDRTLQQICNDARGRR